MAILNNIRINLKNDALACRLRCQKFRLGKPSGKRSLHFCSSAAHLIQISSFNFKCTCGRGGVHRPPRCALFSRRFAIFWKSNFFQPKSASSWFFYFDQSAWTDWLTCPLTHELLCSKSKDLDLPKKEHRSQTIESEPPLSSDSDLLCAT